jgi:hypothetical protein
MLPETTSHMCWIVVLCSCVFIFLSLLHVLAWPPKASEVAHLQSCAHAVHASSEKNEASTKKELGWGCKHEGYTHRSADLAKDLPSIQLQVTKVVG